MLEYLWDHTNKHTHTNIVTIVYPLVCLAGFEATSAVAVMSVSIMSVSQHPQVTEVKPGLLGVFSV